MTAPRAVVVAAVLGASWALLGVAGAHAAPALLLAAAGAGLFAGEALARRWRPAAAQTAAAALLAASLLAVSAPTPLVLDAVAFLGGLGAAGALAAVPADGQPSLGFAAALGAAVSALLAGEVLAPGLGLQALARGAAVLSAMAGVLALLERGRPTAPASDAGWAAPAVVAVMLWCGAAAWLLWRGAALLLTSAVREGVSAGPLLGGAVLLGVAAGSRWRRPTVEVALGLWGAAVGAALFLLGRAPPLFLRVTALFRHAPEAWLPLQLAFLALCAAVLAPAAFFFAAAVWGARAEAPRGGLLPAAFFGAAGAGAVVRLAAGRLGPHGLLLLGGASLLVALGVWVLRRGRARRALAVTCLVGAAALAAASLTVDLEAPSTFTDGQTVATLSTEDGHRVLRVDGEAAGSDGANLDWQLLAPALGVLGRPVPPRRALLVGAGTGVSAHALLSLSVDRLDIVIPSAALRRAAVEFGADGAAAFADPRCHVTVADVDAFLAASTEVWDVVVLLPDPTRGVCAERLRLAQARLAPHGRLVQVLRTADSSDHLAQLAVRTLRATFPHATTWLGPDTWALVATREPQPWSFDALQDQLARPAAAAELARLGIGAPTDVLVRQAQSDQGQAAFAGEGDTNSEDRDLLRFGAPVAAFVGGDATVPDERTGPTRGRALELARWTQRAPFGPVQYRGALEHLGRVQLPNDPLLRALAEAWHAQAPTVEAAVALAQTALAQGSPSVARRALEPWVAAGARQPEVITQWLVLRWAELRRQGAPWNPVEVADAVALGREAVAAHPGDADLRAAVSRLEAVQ